MNLDSEVIHARFGEDFNPFLGMTHLQGRKRDSIIGRSKPFQIEDALAGEVVLEKGVRDSRSNGGFLIESVNGEIELRPLNSALGMMWVHVYPLKELDHLVTCFIKVGPTTVKSYNWNFFGYVGPDQGEFFYDFYKTGRGNNPAEKLIIATDLTGPDPDLYKPRFRMEKAKEYHRLQNHRFSARIPL